jgi:hypothetical protein
MTSRFCFSSATLAEDVLQFLRDIEGLAAPDEFEPDFFYRMQWLPYVGQAAHGGVRLQLLLGHAGRWANGEWTDRQAAAALLHLALDAFIYLEQGKPNRGVSMAETVAETPAPYDAPAAKPASAPALPGTASLPEVLRAGREASGIPEVAAAPA